MDVRSAIKRVAAFCAKDGPYSHVQLASPKFFPERPIYLLDGRHPLPHVPAVVGGSDGITSCVIELDPHVDVPDVSPCGKTTLGALASHHDPVRFERTTQNLTCLASHSGTTFVSSVPSGSLDIVTARCGGTTRLSEWKARRIFAVLHAAAAAKDIDKAGLELIHVAPGFVEATDQARIARASVDTGLPDCLVSPAIFQKLDKNVDFGVHYGTVGELLVLHVGEEVRTTRMFSSKGYPDHTSLIPVHAHNMRYRVRQVLVSQLLPAVKAAAKASTANVIELLFGHHSVEVRGMTHDGGVAASVMVPDTGEEKDRVAIRAKSLLQSVQAFHQIGGDVNVIEVNHAGPGIPIRLAWDGFAELVYPLVPQEAKP